MTLISKFLFPPLASFGHDAKGVTFAGMLRGTLYRVGIMCALALAFCLVAVIGLQGGHHTSDGFVCGVLLVVIAWVVGIWLRPVPSKVVVALDTTPAVSLPAASPERAETMQMVDDYVYLAKNNPTRLKAIVKVHIKRLKSFGVSVYKRRFDGTVIRLPQKWEKAAAAGGDDASSQVVKLVAALTADGHKLITIVVTRVVGAGDWCAALLGRINRMVNLVSARMGVEDQRLCVDIPSELVSKLVGSGLFFTLANSRTTTMV